MWKIYLDRFKQNKLALAGFFMILFLLVVAVFAPIIATYDPLQQAPLDRLQSPSSKHWLGTDDLGRDVFSRVVYGTRISLTVGFAAVGISVLIGATLGLFAGYFGGFLDSLLMRFVDIMLCFPTIFLIIMIIAFVGPNIYTVMFVIGITSWPGLSRLVRGECLSLREREFVQAGKILGLPNPRILFIHILPNVLGVILVSASLNLGGAILTETALSFLGLGVQPPTPSWGNMLTGGKDYIYMGWWMTFYPGLAIFITVLAYYLFGEGLRDIFDPRLD